MRCKAALIVLATARVAAADPAPAPAPIELLHNAPSVVAVSSAVANAQYLPEHLVDGKLDTAWNSRTGEGTGSWIQVRVPAGAHITAIKLTAGFTRSTKRDGDLFTGNPRVQLVHIDRAGTSVADQKLDVDSRALQEIPLDIAGGDLTIRISALVPGTKPTWRETCVSELEVWGTLPADVAPKPQQPRVVIGDLDAPPAPAFADCQKLLYPHARGGRTGPDPTDDWLIDWDAIGVGRDLAVCRIEHNAQGQADVTADVAAVKRTGKGWALVVAPYAHTVQRGQDPSGMNSTGGSVAVAPFPLTTGETGVTVTTIADANGPMFFSKHTQVELDRVTDSGLVKLFGFESNVSESESKDADECTLAPPAALKKAMPRLELQCKRTIGRYHGEDPRGNGDYTTDYTRKLTWSAATGAYIEKTP